MDAPISVPDVISALVQPPMTECPTVSLAGQLNQKVAPVLHKDVASRRV